MIAELPAPTQMTALEGAVPACVAERSSSKAWQQINDLEQAMAQLPQQVCPLTHTFTPGLYTRTILMPAGTKLTSRIHLYEHPFVISQGIVRVRDGDSDWVTLTAPHIGVTKPGARRILDVIEDTVWSTFHVTDETDPEKIVDAVTYPHMNLGHMDFLSDEQMAAIRTNQRGIQSAPKQGSLT
jgi:hypothetical protein